MDNPKSPIFTLPSWEKKMFDVLRSLKEFEYDRKLSTLKKKRQLVVVYMVEPKLPVNHVFGVNVLHTSENIAKNLECFLDISIIYIVVQPCL